MVQVKISSIPDLLCGSILYQNLAVEHTDTRQFIFQQSHCGDVRNQCESDGTEDDNTKMDIIAVPLKYYKIDRAIDSSHDLEHFLATLHYWGLDDVYTDELLAFCFARPGEAVPVLRRYRDHMPYLQQIEEIALVAPVNVSMHMMVLFCNNDAESRILVRMDKAAELENLTVLRYLNQCRRQCRGAVENISCSWDGDGVADDAAGAAIIHHQTSSVMDIVEGSAAAKEEEEKEEEKEKEEESGTCTIAASGQKPVASSSKCPLSFGIDYWQHQQQTPQVQVDADSSRHNQAMVPAEHKLAMMHISNYVAAKSTNIDVLRFLLEEAGFPSDASTTGAAITNHQSCFLDYLLELGCPLPPRAIAQPDVHLVAAGSVKALKIVHEKYGTGLNSRECDVAAMCGHLDCLRYLHEQGCQWHQSTCGAAIRGDHLHVLQYLHEQGCPWSDESCTLAAEFGRIDCLRYAHEQGCEWSHTTCAVAAEHGHLDCLKYAFEHGCLWHRDTCSTAAMHGHLDCLQFAHEHGCPWCSLVLSYATLHNHKDCVVYACENGCPAPPTNLLRSVANWEILSYLTSLPAMPLPNGGAGAAADTAAAGHDDGKSRVVSCKSVGAKGKQGDEEVVKHSSSEEGHWWAVNEQNPHEEQQHQYYVTEQADKRFPWNRQVMQWALQRHGLQRFGVEEQSYLSCAPQRGYALPMLPTVAAHYAKHGLLDSLRYAYKVQGCPWDHTACAAAASSGSLGCLQYLHEHGCSWGVEVCSAAASTGHIECLSFALDHGCTWDASAVLSAARAGRLACLQLLLRKAAAAADTHNASTPTVTTTATGITASNTDSDQTAVKEDSVCRIISVDQLQLARDEAAQRGHRYCAEYIDVNWLSTPPPPPPPTPPPTDTDTADL